MESPFRRTVVLGLGIPYILYQTFYMINSGVPLSNTFRYIYSKPGEGFKSLESQLKLAMVLGFTIPYILYQKLFWLQLVCTSPTFSGISTLSQEGF